MKRIRDTGLEINRLVGFQMAMRWGKESKRKKWIARKRLPMCKGVLWAELQVYSQAGGFVDEEGDLFLHAFQSAFWHEWLSPTVFSSFLLQFNVCSCLFSRRVIDIHQRLMHIFPEFDKACSFVVQINQHTTENIATIPEGFLLSLTTLPLATAAT